MLAAALPMPLLLKLAARNSWCAAHGMPATPHSQQHLRASGCEAAAAGSGGQASRSGGHVLHMGEERLVPQMFLGSLPSSAPPAVPALTLPAVMLLLLRSLLL